MERRVSEVDFRSEYAAKRVHRVIGLMSGTSLDGVDAVLLTIRDSGERSVESVDLLAHAYLPYSDEVRRWVSRLCSPESARIDDLTCAHYGLSEWYAEAVFSVLSAAGVRVDAVDAVALHGQTVWHAPQGRPFPGPRGELTVVGTLQLGNPSVLRERTGLPVVSDLRARDMAAGGEGAPLAPYIDALLFGDEAEGRVVQNIGGIGNATVLPAGVRGAGGTGIVAFDTGPGNMVIDAVVAAGTDGKARYDDGGALAAAGEVEETLVEELMGAPYFARKPPKSTGREVYGAAFAEGFLHRAAALGLSFPDTVATATAFTAESIARAYRDFVLPSTQIATVLVAGGGARNPTLLSMIESRLPGGLRVRTSAEFGVPDEAREAMAFALIAHESLLGRPANLPSVTGARHPAVLGNLTL